MTAKRQRFTVPTITFNATLTVDQRDDLDLLARADGIGKSVYIRDGIDHILSAPAILDQLAQLRTDKLTLTAQRARLECRKKYLDEQAAWIAKEQTRISCLLAAMCADAPPAQDTREEVID
jgi:hypothetical protein